MKKPRWVPSRGSLFDNRFDEKRHSDYGHSVRRVDTVDSAVIANIKSLEKNITDILTFRTKHSEIGNARSWNTFVPILQQTFTVWRAIPHIRAENEMADIILSAYLQQRKIRDYIGKMSVFIERIGSMDNPDKVRFMAYNNYLFFLQRFIWDMNEKVTNAEMESIPPIQDEDADTVAWFIRDECRSVSYIRDVPKAYNAIKRIKENLKIGIPMSAQQLQDKKTATLCVDILLQNVPNEDVAEMQRIKGMLNEQIISMRKNVDNAKILYEAINTCFTDEWFNQVDPEHVTCKINDMSNAELETFYKSKIDEFQAMLGTIEI